MASKVKRSNKNSIHSFMAEWNRARSKRGSVNRHEKIGEKKASWKSCNILCMVCYCWYWLPLRCHFECNRKSPWKTKIIRTITFHSSSSPSICSVLLFGGVWVRAGLSSDLTDQPKQNILVPATVYSVYCVGSKSSPECRKQRFV